MKVSVIIPTLNPEPRRLRRTLRALQAQSLPGAAWECVLVDNASSPPLQPADWAHDAPGTFRVVRESRPGLSHARRCGFRATSANVIVLVDDDNELAPDYLAESLRLLAAHPQVGVGGGRSLPEFEQPPATWVREFDGLIACRDLGDTRQISAPWPDTQTGRNTYPTFAPIGAGMVIRREALAGWLDQGAMNTLPDREGLALTSGGDNDIVMYALRSGWAAAYFPTLRLTHLIPAGRLEPAYLGRLNHSIQKSWMQVLTRHAANPWPALSPFGARLRPAKAWVAYRAWRSPAARIRWLGACGHFEGRISPP